jgi:D-beta-D-heptose 7-phosphate kinase/D-beta-D-heptose 1-phosphate adenosyltransferase
MIGLVLPPAREGAAPRLLVIGDLMLDRFVQGDASRLSLEAPVPIVREREGSEQPGGAANVAVNLAALGARVSLLGAVGDDPEAVRLRDLVRAGGVETVELVTCADRPTTVKTRLVARRQQVARVDREWGGPLPPAGQRELMERLNLRLPGCAVVVVPDYGKGVITGDVWSGLVAAAGRAQVPVMVDPAPQARIGFYRGAAVIKPNWAEAAGAARREADGAQSLDEVGKVLLAASGAPCVIVTRGEEGLTLFRQGRERLDLPALRREVYDVTGAGDTVLATLAWGRAAGLAEEAAARLANLAGGLAVERFGAAVIGRRDLEQAMVPETGLTDKLIPRAELQRFLKPHRQAGRRIAFTNGCFDILHAGHVRLLRHAAAQADLLVIGLNSDASVRAWKGAGRPIVGEQERGLVLAALPEVDAVVIFDEPTPEAIIDEVRPYVLVKGGDYRPEEVIGREQVESTGGRLELVPLREGISTTEIVRRIRSLPDRESDGPDGRHAG